MDSGQVLLEQSHLIQARCWLLGSCVEPSSSHALTQVTCSCHMTNNHLTCYTQLIAAAAPSSSRGHAASPPNAVVPTESNKLSPKYGQGALVLTSQRHCLLASVPPAASLRATSRSQGASVIAVLYCQRHEQTLSLELKAAAGEVFACIEKICVTQPSENT